MTLPLPDPRKLGEFVDDPAVGQFKSPPPDAHDVPLPPQASGQPKNRPSANLSAAPNSAVDQDGSLLESLRELNAEMLDLQDVLLKVQQGETTLATFAGYIQKTIADVDVLAADYDTLARNPDVSDTIRHILNGWEKMKANPLLVSPTGDHNAQEQLHYLNMLGDEINKIVFLCCSLTIPNRLAEWLDSTRPEKYIPFNEVFADELPSAADRQRLLNHLAWGEKAVKNGYVDLDAGLIYRYSRSRTARLLSILYLVLALALLTGLVVGSCYLGLPGWLLAAKDLTIMLSGWAALLVGIIVHIGIGSIKRTQGVGALPTQIVSSDLFFIINARFGQILLKLFIALIGFFALVFTAGITQVTLFNCFLVGYSLDSFVEMFGSSLEKSSSAQLGAIKKQLGVE